MERFANRKLLSVLLVVCLMAACTRLERNASPAPAPTDRAPMAIVMAAELAVARGDIARASTLYDRTAERLSDVEVIARGARLALRAGDMAAASRLGGRWVALAPDSGEARRLQGLVSLRRGNTERAIDRFLEGLPTDPGDRDAVIDRLGQRLRDSALPPEALDVMRAVAASAPQSEGAQLALARLAIHRDQPAVALEVVASVLASRPESRNARLIRADALLELDRIDEALAVFRALLAESPDNEALGFEYARALMAGNRDSQALEQFRSLVEAGTTRLQLLNAAVVVALRSGDDDLALTALQRLRATNAPLGRRSLLLEGRLLRRLDRLEESLDVFDLALQPRPDDAELRYARAMTRFAAGDLEGGEADLRHVLRDNPDNPEALNALGYVLVDQTDRIREGAKLIERAYEIRPDAPAIVDSMGWAAFRQGRLEEALGFLERAHERTNGDPEIAAHLGEVLWVLDRRDEARTVWRDAQQAFDGDHPVLEETMERLDQ
ncbi:tetratricopeptide repeat protein [Spiribacter vilamensis]|uniref:Tetratricopeptide repeat protein n=1 Tax=Spiribacter vilamensis TaxID=531306 RepID=A0A4Q8CY22_9GAMM|nr:tetratricopeptide repeat protein [Spiribacter vilamensis]RZU97858.1 tetratricopeptide repeat protein [Spiribacter vilamensis]TVO61222.1 tetratricopeptide repeat protein [Spiribacter vilamensis]